VHKILMFVNHTGSYCNCWSQSSSQGVGTS